MKRRAFQQSGSTLMLALWALVLISAVVFAWIKVINMGLDDLNQANRGMEARAAAHSGIAVAMHPSVTNTSPMLNGNFGDGRGYHVKIKGEGGRINLNYFLTGNDPAKIQFLKQVLALQGLSFQQREVFMDCLLDWVSPSGGIRRLNSIPEGPNYHPPHRPLQSLDEIPLIHGCEQLVSDPKWKDDFTIYTTGPLDLECVPADILALVPGIGEQRAQQFVKIREKLEMEDRNQDGHPFKNLTEALSFLGFNQEQFSQISAFLGFRDPVQHIESMGESEKVVRQVDAIVRKVPGANTQILLWNEN